MTDEIHAHHEVDRVLRDGRLRQKRLRAHRARREVRRLLAVERGHDDAPARSFAREVSRDVGEHRDGRRVVIGAPERLAAERAEVIVVRAHDDEARIVARDRGKDVRAAAAGHRLFERIEARFAQRFEDELSRGDSTGRSGLSAGTARAAQGFDELDSIHRR
jgi:hypothetical protein